MAPVLAEHMDISDAESKLETIAARVMSRVWLVMSAGVRDPLFDARAFIIQDEIRLRNVSRLTIWNRIPRES